MSNCVEGKELIFRYIATVSNVLLAEIQAAEPKNLPIFGHTHDLLQNVFTSKDVCIHSKGNMTAVSAAGMTVSSKTDLRFPIPGQAGHGSRIIQYTGTMVYSRFKSENVGDKHAKALPEDEWKRVENCHEAIISKADFEKVAAMRKGNTCASAKRKHETHCLTGKMICGNCGHRLSHTYAGRPKYYCAKHYLDKSDGKCNISVLDADMESVVKKALQMMIDVLVDSRKVVDMQREKQAERLKQEKKHLSDMEHSRELIEKDLREAYESYKLGMTDKETYLEQRKTYEQMLASLQENIEKQMAAVTKMADVDVPEVAGLEMLEGQLKLTGLNREMVDAFVEEIVVYAKDRVEIKWKFRDEFAEMGKVEKDRIFGGADGSGVV